MFCQNRCPMSTPADNLVWSVFQKLRKHNLACSEFVQYQTACGCRLESEIKHKLISSLVYCTTRFTLGFRSTSDALLKVVYV